MSERQKNRSKVIERERAWLKNSKSHPGGSHKFSKGGRAKGKHARILRNNISRSARITPTEFKRIHQRLKDDFPSPKSWWERFLEWLSRLFGDKVRLA